MENSGIMGLLWGTGSGIPSAFRISCKLPGAVWHFFLGGPLQAGADCGVLRGVGLDGVSVSLIATAGDWPQWLDVEETESSDFALLRLSSVTPKVLLAPRLRIADLIKGGQGHIRSP